MIVVQTMQAAIVNLFRGLLSASTLSLSESETSEPVARTITGIGMRNDWQNLSTLDVEKSMSSIEWANELRIDPRISTVFKQPSEMAPIEYARAAALCSSPSAPLVGSSSPLAVSQLTNRPRSNARRVGHALLFTIRDMEYFELLAHKIGAERLMRDYIAYVEAEPRNVHSMFHEYALTHFPQAKDSTGLTQEETGRILRAIDREMALRKANRASAGVISASDARGGRAVESIQTCNNPPTEKNGSMNQIAWTDESPTEPGWYVWTMDGRYCVWNLTAMGKGDLAALPCDLPVSEYDGWWLGPLPSPQPFIRLPRVSDTQIASRPKRQQIRQSDAARLLLGCSRGESPSATELLCHIITTNYAIRLDA